MKDFFNKLKIPTILGLGVIIMGIVSGVFLTLQEQTFTSQASPDVKPQNITLSNISDIEVTISWQTSTPVPSFIKFGQSSADEITVLDDRDNKTPTAYSTHYVTLKNLLPKTAYVYKIISGKLASEAGKFTTAAPLSLQTGFRPIIGSVLAGNRPLEEGIAYLSIGDATTQSAQILSSGNFLIPTSEIRTLDLSESFPLADDSLAKLTIVSSQGQATAIFNLKVAEEGLPPITIGEDLDLTNLAIQPSPLPVQDLARYDLNSDGAINSADNSIILGNMGKNPKNKKADLNEDGEVNQKDLDLMLQKIKDLVFQ